MAQKVDGNAKWTPRSTGEFERLARQLGSLPVVLDPRAPHRRGLAHRHPQFGFDELPVAAVEVVVSETGQALWGSISTRELICADATGASSLHL
jgi:hypothetical protein